jgi:hypothetical protein
MVKEQFRDWKPEGELKVSYKDANGNERIWKADQLQLLEKVQKIIEEFQQQKIKLTNRQTYYQLVAKNIIPNADKVYKRICVLLTDARYGGYIDWDAIEDRGRVAERHAEWQNVAEFMNDAVEAFRLPRWDDQECYVELFTEKQAAESILSPLANIYHIHFAYNKGYSSAVMIYDLSKRIIEQIYKGKKVKILYCGDHDPSGVDMIRDIQERVIEFLMKGDDAFNIYRVEEYFEIIPLALSMEQVRQYNPPPNPAKIKDPRATWYIEKYGNSGWELDALRPEVLRNIVEIGIQEHLDIDKYNAWIVREQPWKQKLQEIADSLVNSDHLEE